MATFMGPYSQSIEPDIRLEDYLDDKLQSTTDLENLDTLLASVEYQRSQLQSQLDDATKELEESRKSSADRQAALSSQIQEFQTLQKSIDVRLQILAASDAPDEAIRRLEQPMKQLHKVDLAHKYLLLLQDVEELRSAARSHLPQSPKAALEPYSRLKQLSMRLKELQPAADEAAAHLVTHVANISSNLWDEMKQTMWNELEAVLTKRGWPKIDPQLEIDDEWRECFEKLLDLQVPELIYSKDVVTLLPIDVMAQIFVKEFRFHFMSDKTTSSPQAIGTHCFPWFLALVERWEDFLRDNFTYIVASKLHNSAASGKMVYMDPVCAFISSMLPVMREKVNSAMVEAVNSPTFLSSLIAQLLSFDEALRSRFNYDGGDVENGWGGLTAEVLDKDFAKWLRAEKDFALERFQGIMGSQDARNIDYEFAGAGKTKPTYGAVRVTDLLRSVTSQYERVRRFSHKLRFLIDIQLAILDEYHSRLRGSLEAYQSLTSTVGRTLHGVTKEELAALEGTGALETLCKVFGSSDHIVNTLKDWSNEEFFVTLWEQLQARAKASEDQTNLAGGMSYDHVKDRTSSTVGTEDDGGVLFDETIVAYTQRRERAADFLIEALVESHHKAFRAYLQRPQWTTINEDISAADPYQLGITAELAEPLRILKRNLEFLSRALGTAVFRRIWRSALDRLNMLLWSEVLMSQSFTTYGAAQFARDLHAMFSTLERYIPDGSGSLRSLEDAVRLLNLPIEPQEGVTSLKQATDRVFTDNTQAKKLLEELELDSLTPANARQILYRRVENSE
ncbi:TIP-1 family-domain-containing protein [Phialemonium atrogriseum]|uniref:TIP-1 family-domain-containing protein n=1 Tax=Phialemonium atrogriseum TaxID=1093897 RepID=A0AAJ0FFD8_9PEZI|nr:TIP-1 family-domain-containing protein [Phialemonium atrogriseum]KAK1766496.1 TIP-1 family-domain-containing protein [Phialemonium atrogriseum]